MILARSPMRIPLGGGGTDLPSYYEKHGGFVISAAIDKYVYASVHSRFVEGFLLKYMQTEEAATIDEIKHTRIREALRLMKIEQRNLELTFLADVPAGTGLGSSSSFTAALLAALHAYKRESVHPRQIAEEACQIELDVLKEPIGKQDQYITAFGGVTCLGFSNDETVEVWPLKLSEEALSNLEEGLVLFFTGYTRPASEILKEQDDRSRAGDAEVEHNLMSVKRLAVAIQIALEVGDLKYFGLLMNEHWHLKRQRSPKASNHNINKLYAFAIANGAIGGKLVGAGGGGFLLFYTEQKRRLRWALREQGLREVRFRFDFEGTKVLLHG